MNTGLDETDVSPFWSEATENYPATDVQEMYRAMKKQMENELSFHLSKGSGWRFKEVIHLEVKIYCNKRLRGSSYVDLPKSIKDERTVINIQTKDNECFQWSVLRAMYPVKKNAE